MKLYQLVQQLYDQNGNIECIIRFNGTAKHYNAAGLNGHITNVPALWADEDVEDYHLEYKSLDLPPTRVEITMV